MPAGGEDAADIAVRLPFGRDRELSGQRAFCIQAVVGFDADVMVFRCGNRCEAKVGSFGNSRQIVLLLFGATPQFAAERNPGRIERHIGPAGKFHDGDTVVEVVGRNAFHTAASHRHGRIGFEACHAQECDQGSGNIFADTATVRIVHFQVVQCVAFTFAHRNAGVTDIVGNPMSENGDLFHFRLFAFDQLVHFLLGFGNSVETTVVLVYFIEPKRFVLPSWCG